MKISLEVKETKEYNIKYLCACVNVRYWEDADVNDEEDISYEEQEKGEKPRVPLAEENPNAKYPSEKYCWNIKIDANTGNIVGWPKGVTADIHYKVCDEGTYSCSKLSSI